MAPVDTVPAHQGWSAPGHLVRTPGQDDRYIVTASTPGVQQVCNAAAGPCFPVSKISRHSNVRLSVRSAAQDEHPVTGTMQHAGEAEEAYEAALVRA
jgi:hypothetical protein